MDPVVSWDNNGIKDSQIELHFIEPFDARGMRRLYGRGDHFPEWRSDLFTRRRRAFNMDVWKDRNNRVFARFWSRSDDVDWCSYEIIGMSLANYDRHATAPLDECWVPQCLRTEYDEWIVTNI
jgi:hypothetical protein